MADIKISQLGEALAVTDNDILPMTASGVTSKVKASTMKSYMVDDLDVSDLHDTTITAPTDGDGLVYNGTSQKWENKQITTKEQWKKNGAYNLCPVTAKTQSLGGLTITVNSDGSVTVGSGTATSLIDLVLNAKTDMILDDGNYRLVGCPNHQYVSLRVVTNNYNTNKVYDYGTGGNFSFSNSVDKNAAVYLRVNSGTVISSPITFKPMITTDLNATYDDFVPHAMTNRELTKVKNYRYQTANAEANVTYLECNVLKNGRIVYITGSWQGNNTNTEPLLILPTELRPSDIVRGAGGAYIPSISVPTQFGVYQLTTDGKISQGIDTRKASQGSFVFIYNL